MSWKNLAYVCVNLGNNVTSPYFQVCLLSEALLLIFLFNFLRVFSGVNNSCRASDILFPPSPF